MFLKLRAISEQAQPCHDALRSSSGKQLACRWQGAKKTKSKNNVRARRENAHPAAALPLREKKEIKKKAHSTAAGRLPLALPLRSGHCGSRQCAPPDLVSQPLRLRLGWTLQEKMLRTSKSLNP